jgi:penicillin-insensitive murein endopeptidase
VSAKDKFYVYGETGWAGGGEFKPHKTHQNGLSVDFMVPVINKAGKSIPLPCNALNKYGYEIDFNSKGMFKEYTIDYEAMAEHLYQLHASAKDSGIGIWRVIFDPGLQAPLFKTARGQYLEQNLTFSKKPSWVRHDEHYHVDFRVECKPLK